MSRQSKRQGSQKSEEKEIKNKTRSIRFGSDYFELGTGLADTF